jgi:hypothetical protein
MATSAPGEIRARKDHGQRAVKFRAGRRPSSNPILLGRNTADAAPADHDQSRFDP